MIRFAQIALLCSLGFVALGCVSQAGYDDLQKVNRTLEEQIVELKLQLEQARDQIRFLRQSAGSSGSVDTAMMSRISAAEARAARLQSELAAANAALAAAEANIRSIPTDIDVMLPRELDQALRQLANQNPGLMTYDPEQGMIKLESDLTFALGSTTVSPQAQTALRRLAGVLNSPAASPYEVRVVGHTDNVPVKNPANVRKFGDNWGLSVFRAIAVKDVLEKTGIQPSRFLVAGYGQYHPIVPNGSRGARQNRRVEIYLVESKQSGMSVGSSNTRPVATPIRNTTTVAEEAFIEEVPSKSGDEPVMFK